MKIFPGFLRHFVNALPFKVNLLPEKKKHFTELVTGFIRPNYTEYMRITPISVAVRSKSYICSRFIAKIAGSNHAEGMDVRLLVCCVLCK